MKNKVIIEITSEGWTTTVHIGKKKFIEKHIATSTGAECVSGDFEKEDEISDDLYNELSSFTQYNIMRAL